MAVNYRTVSIFSSVATAILCAIVLAFQITAIVEYRAKDFFTATDTEDFASFGTCVEGISEDQLQWENYDDPNIYCGPDKESGNRGSLRNSLAVSVHGLYYTKFSPDAVGYVSSQPPKYFEHDVYMALDLTVSSVITATVGGAAKEIETLGKETEQIWKDGQASGTETPPAHWNGRQPIGINFTTAYLALRYVAQQKVPTSCDEIYGLTPDDIKKDEYGQVQFMSNIVEGKYVGKYEMGPHMPIKDSWPLRDIVVDCNYNETHWARFDEMIPFDDPTPGTYPIDVTADPPITEQQKALLHAHCHAQFDYASVGTISHHAGTLDSAGTWMIPLPGIRPGPKWTPWPWPEGFFSNTTTASQRAKTFLGMRFGLSLFSYIPTILTTCFLLADSVAFFLSEITMPSVMVKMQVFYADRLPFIRDSLVMAATKKSSRFARLAISIISIVLSGLFYYVFNILPWGFFYGNTPRPICDAWDPQQLWFNFGLFKGTIGGWKADWEAKWFESATYLALVFVIAIVPFTTSYVFRDANTALGGGNAEQGRIFKDKVVETMELVKNSKDYQTMRKGYINVMWVSMVFALAGQAFANAVFGQAWAVSVVNQPTEWVMDDALGISFENATMSTLQLTDLIYDQTVATLALTVTFGLVFGAVLQRHLFGGLGCAAGVAFFAWVALVIVFALPLFVYSSIRSIGHRDAASYDCTDFSLEGTFSTAPTFVCDIRFYSLLGFGGLFVLMIILITVTGGARIIAHLLCKAKAREFVPYADGSSLAQAPQPGSKFFSAGPATTVAMPLMQGVDEAQLPLGGYRSSNAFFNFKTKRTDSDAFLYAPRMRTPAAR